MDRAHLETVREALPELLLGSGKPSALAPEGERRADDRRREPWHELVERADDDALGHGQSGRAHGVAKGEPVLGPSDRVEVRADQLDPERVEDALLAELDRQVERGLPPERRQERVGALLLDDRGERVGVEGLDVGRVGPGGVGHDRRRVRVHEHDPVALRAKHAAGLRAGVVELAPLPDADRAGADDQDAA